MLYGIAALLIGVNWFLYVWAVNAGFVVETNHVKRALRQVRRLTGISGRWQQLSDRPRIIADAAHNHDGIARVTEALQATAHNTLHVVIGVVNDKDIDAMLAALPKKAHYYFVKADISRALDAQTLRKKAMTHRLSGKDFGTVSEGLKAARKAAKKDDLIFIGGSMFVVGEALAVMKR